MVEEQKGRWCAVGYHEAMRHDLLLPFDFMCIEFVATKHEHVCGFSANRLLMGSFWCRDDRSSLMTPRERRDNLASSKTTTEITPIMRHAISSSNSGLSSFHIIKPDKHEGYLAYKIHCHPPVIPLEASVIS